jgi:glycerol-1-phosphate dehydrogenase [NAD(P)+]
MNDLCRVISARCRIPYVIIATAPSMDGYASAVSPVVMDGNKCSIRLCVPHAILADSALLKTAPQVMVSSGVGDILGKYVAIRDWRLAHREKGEYICDYIISLVEDAVGRCVAGIADVCSRKDSALLDMVDTLIMSGAAIAMHGESSRPASGCEHQLAHYWEVALLNNEKESPLHGNLVALGTQAACRLYQLAMKEFDLDFPGILPKPEEITAMMAQLGDFSSMKTLGVTRELFYQSFFHATESNGRYTLITYLSEKGRLEHYAELLTKEFFS